MPLHFRNGHLFVDVGGSLWLIDTGSPGSFGIARELRLGGEDFHLSNSLNGLTPPAVSEFVGVECLGLLGADVLNSFDFVFSVPAGRLLLSIGDLQHNGDSIPLDAVLGIPIVTASVAGVSYRMFFDTGAQYSYFQDESLSHFPSAGQVQDFYHGFGHFEVATYSVPVTVGRININLRCGALPGILGTSLMFSGAVGIIGNEIFAGREVGYFPRRQLLVL